MNAGFVARACGAMMALGMAVSIAQAQQHDRPAQQHDRPGGAARVEHFDSRYNHNHYYASHGAVVERVPGRPIVVGGGRYFYSGGVWYAPRGPRFVVVGAPVGFFVPVLPPYYTTVWVAGAPYYYANDAYYQWNADQNGYVVVDPPAGDPGQAVYSQTAPAGAAPPPGGDLYIYPQNGQSEDQQANDKYECHKWASSQSGFDPTQAGGGVPPDQAAQSRANYQRAMRACLEGRGYSVK